VYNYEAAGAAAVMGVQWHTVANQADGSLCLQAVADAIRPDDIHYAPTTMVTVENTHNMCGGTVIGVEYMEALGSLCRQHALPLHVDGARIFNAATALGTPVRELVAAADSVSVCLSKNLGCPAGSVLVGDTSFIARARRLRKLLGGGMRQSGVLAAAGLVALQQNVTRLDVDHINARQLAAGLGRLPGIECEVPETNIVLIRSQVGPNGQRVGPHLDALMDAMKARGVRLGYGYDSSVIRAVTHLGITCEDIATVVARFRDVLPSLLPPPAALGPALDAAGCEHDVVLCLGLQKQRRQEKERTKDASGCFVLLVKITFKTGAKTAVLPVIPLCPPHY